MNPEDVPAELVEAALRTQVEAGSRIPPEETGTALNYIRDDLRRALAAVLPVVKRRSHREGYETARADMVSGAFVGGPTYEALRDSFTGRLIAKEALVRAADEAWMNRYSGASDALRRYAARLRSGASDA